MYYYFQNKTNKNDRYELATVKKCLPVEFFSFDGKVFHSLFSISNNLGFVSKTTNCLVSCVSLMTLVHAVSL